MSTRLRVEGVVHETAAAGYAVLALGLVVAPALIIDSTARGGGVAPSWQALDLLAVSAVLGLGYAIVCYRRLRRQGTMTRSRPNVWIAAVNALVALGLASSVLLAVVLHELGSMQALLAGQEWTLLALWGAVQAGAIVVAEVVERGVFRWLTAPERRAAAGHGQRPVPARHYRRGP